MIASTVMLALVLALRLWLSWVGPLPGDRTALREQISYHSPSALVLEFTQLCASAGTAVTAALTLLVAGVAVARSDGRRGLIGLALAFAGVLFNGILKLLLSPTPLWAEYVPGRNFPSGHVVYAMTVFGYLGLLGWRHRRPEVTAAAVFLIVIMGPARVIDGSHLVSDALAGYLVGGAWLIGVGLWLTAGQPSPPRRPDGSAPHRSGSISTSGSPPSAARASSPSS
jgi:undecaprenyl-diphosphatase